MPRPQSPFVSRLEQLGVALPVALIRALRFETAFRLGEAVGDLAYYLLRPQRRVAMVNLRIAFPEKTDAERRVILREAWRNFGRIGVEFCHMKYLTPANVAERVTFADVAVWERFRPAIGKTGMLILTGHYGNWELFAHSMALYGNPVHLIHRPFRNPLFDRFVTAERSRAGTGLISKRAAAREVVRVMRDNGIVAVPFDQNATGRWGVFADFFGLPASTHPGLARLAMLSGAPVIPAFLVRVHGTWRHRIEILPPVELVRTGDRSRDTVENLRRFNRVFEEAVRRHPDHWIWMHKRWRTRPPGEPAVY